VAVWEIGDVFNDSLYVLAKSEVYKIKVSDLISGNYNWVKQTISPDNNIHKMRAIDEYNAILIGLGQTFKKTSDQGKTWKDISLPAVPLYDDAMDFAGLRNVGDTAYACMNRIMFVDYPTTSASHDIYWSGAIFKTTDNWATYSNLDAALIGKNEGDDASKNPQLAKCNGLNTSVIEYAGNNIVLLWARWYDVSEATKVEHSRVFKSSDSGKNWKVVSDDFGGTNYVMDIKFNGSKGYVAGNKILLKSVDSGETFTDIYPALKAVGGDQFINAITLGQGDEIFVTSTTAVFRSPDGGASWTKFATTTGGNDFYKFDVNSFIVMGSTSKSLFTNDGGATWVNCSAGATIYEAGGVWNENFYALGQGKIYRMPVAGLALNTAISELPSKSELSVLYKASAVELVSPGKAIDRCQVYSVTGRLVSDTKPAANRYELPYRSFVPGIYITRTVSGGKVYTNKVAIPSIH